MTYLLFVAGLALLIKSADWLVDGASAIGRKARVSEMIIGLTIVSFGTSLPELLVTTMSSLEGKPDLGISNVLGSNIANVLLILGLAALIRPLPLQRDTYFIEIPFSLFAAVLLGFLANTGLVFDSQHNVISRFDGTILIYFFSMFMVYIFVVARQKKTKAEDEVVSEHTPGWKSAGQIILGITGLYFGGNWVVDGATHVARQAGLSEAFVGLTIVAVGTSLPELVTSAVAAYKNNIEVAVGNAIGSNIFNILWILGFTSLLTPIPYNPASNTDILMIVIATSALILAVILGKRPAISRFEGGCFILIYAGYVWYLLQNQAS